MPRIIIERNISYDEIRKVYYVNLDYGKDENGKRVKKTKTFKTKSEAKTELKLFEADKIKGELTMPIEDTLNHWLDYWIKNVKKNMIEVTTLYAYVKMIDNHIAPELGEMTLQKITPMSIQKYLTKMYEKGLGSNTVRKHYDLLKQAFQKAVEQEKLSKNPVEKVAPPRKIETEMNFYNSETGTVYETQFCESGII